MSNRYHKTPAGRREAQTHLQGLSRARRNLLLVINDSQSIDYWLSKLKGVTYNDVEWLLAQGFIAAAAVHNPNVPSQEDPTSKLLMHALNTATASQVADVLKAQAWAQLKGLRAYRFVQDVDQCVDDRELRDLARAFVGAIQGEFGAPGVEQLIQALADRRALATPRRPSPNRDSEPSPSPVPPPPGDGIALTPAVGTSPVGFDAAECYRLSRWPSAGALSSPIFSRLASLISHHALPLQQIALRGRVDVAVALGFVQAMQAHGVLEIHRQPCPPGLTSEPAPHPLHEGLPGMMGPSQPNRASAPPAVSSGLLGRLRERLGLR